MAVVIIRLLKSFSWQLYFQHWSYVNQEVCTHVRQIQDLLILNLRRFVREGGRGGEKKAAQSICLCLWTRIPSCERPSKGWLRQKCLHFTVLACPLTTLNLAIYHSLTIKGYLTMKPWKEMHKKSRQYWKSPKMILPHLPIHWHTHTNACSCHNHGRYSHKRSLMCSHKHCTILFRKSNSNMYERRSVAISYSGGGGERTVRLSETWKNT